MTDLEAIRAKFRPRVISLLFVGESPPAGGKFFYVESPMTAFTAKAFKEAHGSRVVPDDQQAFLSYFMSCGCYLDDICHQPIDKLTDGKRKRMLEVSVVDFASRLSELKPSVIAVVVKKIEKYARSAVEQAGLKVPVYVLPFPGHGHQNKYMSDLREILIKHVLPSP